MEFLTAALLAGHGCSNRMIGAFLKRDKGTVSKYLDPIVAVAVAPLEQAEKEKQVYEVILEIISRIAQRAERAQQAGRGTNAQ